MIGTSDFPEGVFRGLVIGVESPVESRLDGLTVLDENVLLADMLGVNVVVGLKEPVGNVSENIGTSLVPF